MSEPSTPARPRQLTMAGGFVIGGSVFLLLSVFDTFASLNSVEMREEVAKVLSSPSGKGLGISISEALSVMRVGLMVAAACAAAAAVLGIYALQRHRGARVALSVLAVPILLTAPLTGGLMGALVAAATLMLWSGPARDWFAGRPVRQPATPPARDSGPAAPQAPHSQQSPPPAPVSTTGTSTVPAATSGFGQRPAEQPASSQYPDTQHAGAEHPQESWSAQTAQHQGHPGSAAGQAPGSAVPVTVKIACVLTWVFSGVVALLYGAMLVALVVAEDTILDQFTDTAAFQRANIDPDMLVPMLWIGCLMFLGWALGACVLAWLTWRRHNWARWLLAVSAGGALVVALFAFPFGTLHQIAAALTIAGLFGSAARTWFAPAPWGPPPGQWSQGPQGSSQVPSSEQQGAGRPGDQGGPQGPGGQPPVW